MPATARKALAELLGTAFLVAAVVGSGIAAARLSPDDTGLQLLENAVVTGAALIALILALAPVSAAFNPLVTLAEVAFRAVSAVEAVVYLAAQFAGAIVGVIVANVMYDLPAVDVSTHDRLTWATAFAEGVAAFGLLLVIFGVIRAGRRESLAVAVGAYITAAYWFTSSTSFANPAVTVARTLSDTFTGIAPGSVGGFVAAQLVGAALAVVVVRFLYPQATRLAAEIGESS